LEENDDDDQREQDKPMEEVQIEKPNEPVAIEDVVMMEEPKAATEQQTVVNEEEQNKRRTFVKESQEQQQQQPVADALVDATKQLSLVEEKPPVVAKPTSGGARIVRPTQLVEKVVTSVTGASTQVAVVKQVVEITKREAGPRIVKPTVVEPSPAKDATTTKKPLKSLVDPQKKRKIIEKMKNTEQMLQQTRPPSVHHTPKRPSLFNTMGSAIKARKTPNFKVIHEKNNRKMENVVDYAQRMKERHALLTNAKQPATEQPPAQQEPIATSTQEAAAPSTPTVTKSSKTDNISTPRSPSVLSLSNLTPTTAQRIATSVKSAVKNTASAIARMVSFGGGSPKVAKMALNDSITDSMEKEEAKNEVEQPIEKSKDQVEKQEENKTSVPRMVKKVKKSKNDIKLKKPTSSTVTDKENNSEAPKKSSIHSCATSQNTTITVEDATPQRQEQICCKTPPQQPAPVSNDQLPQRPSLLQSTSKPNGGFFSNFGLSAFKQRTMPMFGQQQQQQQQAQAPNEKLAKSSFLKRKSYDPTQSILNQQLNYKPHIGSLKPLDFNAQNVNTSSSTAAAAPSTGMTPMKSSLIYQKKLSSSNINSSALRPSQPVSVLSRIMGGGCSNSNKQ